MFGRRSPEVLIVGAGPVGLFAALELAKRGVGVQVVDEAWRPAAHSYALALHPKSLQRLGALGLREGIEAKGYAVDKVVLYDAKQRRAEVKLGEGPHDVVRVLAQDELERMLYDSLLDAGVKVGWNRRAARFRPKERSIEVDIDDLQKASVGYAVSHTEWEVSRSRTLDIPFVIGADGHYSLLRRQLELGFPEVGDALQFAVFETATDADFVGELRVALTDSSDNAVWPMPDRHARFSFQLPNLELGDNTRQKGRLAVEIGSQRYPVIEPARLKELIESRMPWFRGELGAIRWRMAVRFERRWAEQPKHPRMWLVGDAAHMNYPVGAQSMNVAFRETGDLVERIVRVLRDDAPMSEFDDWSLKWRDEWAMLFGDVAGHSTADPWVAAHGRRILSCLPASGDAMRELLGQLHLESKPMKGLG